VHCVWYGEESDELKTDVVPAIALEKAIALEDDDEDDDEDEDDKRKKQGKKKRHDDD
jgi:hypothetical protein